MFLATHPKACLGHEVAERQRRRQAFSLAPQDRLHLPQQESTSRVVTRQMMFKLEYQPAVVGHIFRDEQSTQGRLSNIQPVVLGIEAVTQLFRYVARGGIKLDFLDS